MNNLQYLFEKLDEECKEVSFVCNKIKQFGLYSNNNGALPKTNAELLSAELDDVMAILYMLKNETTFNYVPNEAAILAKVAKVNEYRQISKDLNFVND